MEIRAVRQICSSIVILLLVILTTAGSISFVLAQTSWPECNIESDTYDVEACRKKVQEFKKQLGPNGDVDEAWYTWAKSAPFPLSDLIACAIAPTAIDCREILSSIPKNICPAGSRLLFKKLGDLEVGDRVQAGGKVTYSPGKWIVRDERGIPLASTSMKSLVVNFSDPVILRTVLLFDHDPIGKKHDERRSTINGIILPRSKNRQWAIPKDLKQRTNQLLFDSNGDKSEFNVCVEEIKEHPACESLQLELPKYLYGSPHGKFTDVCHTERVKKAGKYTLKIDGVEGPGDDRYIEIYVNSELVKKVDNPTKGHGNNPLLDEKTARVEVDVPANGAVKVCSPESKRTVKGEGPVNGDDVVWFAMSCKSPGLTPTNGPTSTPRPTTTGNPTPTGGGDGIGFRFSPNKVVKNVGDTFEVQVSVDTKTEKVFGAEAHITYNDSLLSMSSVREGDFFPAILSTNNAGSSSVRGIVAEPADYRTGTGNLATLTFTAVQNGVTKVDFYCNPTSHNSSKIVKNDINASNIIECGANNTLTVQVGEGQQLSPTPTDQEPTRKPTKKPSNGDRAKVIAAIFLAILTLLIILIGL